MYGESARSKRSPYFGKEKVEILYVFHDLIGDNGVKEVVRVGPGIAGRKRRQSFPPGDIGGGLGEKRGGPVQYAGVLVLPIVDIETVEFGGMRRFENGKAALQIRHQMPIAAPGIQNPRGRPHRAATVQFRVKNRQEMPMRYPLHPWYRSRIRRASPCHTDAIVSCGRDS